jgi:hypothetical protein
MGIYYRSISKRTVTVQGHVIALTNFWGKAPILWNDPTPRWDAFGERAERNAAEMWGKVSYVTMAGYGDLSTPKAEYPIAEWDGQSLLDDRFWDDHAVGTVKVIVVSRVITWKPDYEPITDECAWGV